VRHEALIAAVVAGLAAIIIIVVVIVVVCRKKSTDMKSRMGLESGSIEGNERAVGAIVALGDDYMPGSGAPAQGGYTGSWW
jgi:hypothetical protein